MDEIAKLPVSGQASMASIILEELADEDRWVNRFAVSQDRLAKLAEKVRGDIRDGRIRAIGIDEL